MSPLQLLASGTAFIDVRAPVEYSRGAVPNAVNAPLITDREREQIGITYKQHGKRAAIDLGHHLVAGTKRSIRVRRWLELGRQHSDAWLYCARGGLRSAITQEWLSAEGLRLPTVPGGFKTLRKVCLRTLAEAPSTKPWLVIGGRTGAGKTELLRQIRTGIDLEALANHRGSAFGAYASPLFTLLDYVG